MSPAWRPGGRGPGGCASLLPSLSSALRPVLLDLPQVPPASAKQHGVSLSTAATPFQQASGYGQHSYSTGEGCSPPGEAWAGRAHHAHAPLVPSTLGYDDLTPGTAAGDYSKGGYGGSSQTQNKAAGSGPGKGSLTPFRPGLRPRAVVSHPDSFSGEATPEGPWRWGRPELGLAAVGTARRFSFQECRRLQAPPASLI